MLPKNQYPPSVARFLSYKLTIQGCSEKTVYEYGIDLSGFLRFCFRDRFADQETADLTTVMDSDIASIQRQDIYEYLLYLARDKKNGNASRARKLCAIRGFFKFLATKEHSIPDNPAKDIESPSLKPALPKFLTLEESRALLLAVKEHGSSHNLRDYAIITLFLNCGMRVSEMASLSLSDLSGDLERLVVTGKGNKQRVIYLNDSCIAALSEYLSERKKLHCKDPDALFVSRNSLRLSVKSIQWLVYRYLDLAGLGERNLSVHKLRHTAATLLYETGKVDVRVLKDILGHEQLTTTQIYTHVSSDHMKRAMAENPLNDSE
ncbi:MAG: tyrosine-type recombinase/integrase [Clostridia bacterium]|nr:tyrosine-type recombinase/integrase [Clostridia bacterium]